MNLLPDNLLSHINNNSPKNKKRQMNVLIVNTLFLAVGVWTAWLTYYFAPDMPAGLPVEDRRFLHITRGAKNVEQIAGRVHSLITRTHPIKSHRFVREQLAAPLLARSYRLVHQKVIDIDGIPARVFVHKNSLHAEKLPGIIFLHGGGWSSGSSRLFAPALAEIIMRTQGAVKIIAVDYRLVPEFVYPIQFQDSLKAVKAVLTQTDQYNLDPKRIILMGGNLAATVSLRLRDEHFNATGRIKSAILIHPITNAINFLTKSYVQNDNVPLLSRANVIKYVLDYMDEAYTLRTSAKMELNRHVGQGIQQMPAWSYLDGYADPEGDHTVTPSRKLITRLDHKLRDPYMFPMMAESLSNLTRTYILACEYDVLRDDNLAYANRMRDEGTEVELNQLVCFHGALHFYSRTVSGRVMLDQLLDWINIELLKQLNIKRADFNIE